MSTNKKNTSVADQRSLSKFPGGTIIICGVFGASLPPRDRPDFFIVDDLDDPLHPKYKINAIPVVETVEVWPMVRPNRLVEEIVTYPGLDKPGKTMALHFPSSGTLSIIPSLLDFIRHHADNPVVAVTDAIGSIGEVSVKDLPFPIPQEYLDRLNFLMNISMNDVGPDFADQIGKVGQRVKFSNKNPKPLRKDGNDKDFGMKLLKRKNR